MAHRDPPPYRCSTAMNWSTTLWRIAHCSNLLAAVLYGHYICPRNWRHHLHFWRIRQANFERRRFVRPPDRYAMEPIPELRCSRAVIQHQPGDCAFGADHLGTLASFARRYSSFKQRGFYQFDPHEQYYVEGSEGILGEPNRGNRAPRKELVLGKNLDGLRSLSFSGHCRPGGDQRHVC